MPSRLWAWHTRTPFLSCNSLTVPRWSTQTPATWTHPSQSPTTRALSQLVHTSSPHAYPYHSTDILRHLTPIYHHLDHKLAFYQALIPDFISVTTHNLKYLLVRFHFHTAHYVSLTVPIFVHLTPIQNPHPVTQPTETLTFCHNLPKIPPEKPIESEENKLAAAWDFTINLSHFCFSSTSVSGSFPHRNLTYLWPSPSPYLLADDHSSSLSVCVSSVPLMASASPLL